VNLLNDITSVVENQGLRPQLIQNLEEKLPSDMDESAKANGAIVRKRKLRSALDLITVLMVYSLTSISQRMVAAFCKGIGLADISDQAWQKRTVKCVPWLGYILNETMPVTALTAVEKADFNHRRVKLVDGTCVKQDGSKGETLRIHMCYDLTLGCMDDVAVTDHHTAESFEPFYIKPDCIYMADAGYGRGKNLEYIVSRKADAIIRVTPNNIRLAEDPRGKKRIDMTEKLGTDKKVVDFTCYIHTQNRKYIPVRIIASRLPEDKAEAAVKRKKRKANRNQQTLKDETLIYAEWVILMTSLPENYSAESILALYRARWQIELLFKRIKQFFKAAKVRAATAQHSKVLILMWLITWSLIEREVVAAKIYLIHKQADMSRFSPWTMHNLFFQRFKSILCSLWLTCIDFNTDLIEVYKRLQNHKSTRPNQYADFCYAGALSVFA